MNAPTPPRWARLVATWFLSGDEAEFILGDLDELYARRSARIGAGPAARRYVRDALGSVVARTRLAQWWVSRGDGGGSHGGVGSRGRPPRFPDFGAELRVVIRSLMREPGLAAVVVLTMGVAIGANTAVFSVVDGVLLRPFDYPEPDRVVRPYIFRFGGEEAAPRENFTGAHYLLFRERMRSFEALGAYSLPYASSIGGDDRPTGVQMTIMTPSAFEAVGVQPVLGRLPASSDLETGDRPIVLDHGLWQDRYGSDPEVLGRTVDFHGGPAVIVGVMPPGFDFPNPDIRVWGTFDEADLAAVPSTYHWLRLVGRLAPEATEATATAEMSVLVPRVVESDVDSVWVANTFDGRVELRSLQDEVVGSAQATIQILFWATLAVLLVACANITSLLLVRAEGRTGEHALRRALGSARWSLMRLVLLESLVLGLAGALLGLALAYVGTRALVAWPPAQGLPRLYEVEVSRTVLLFTLATTLLASLLAGTVPALRAASNRALAALRDGGRTRTDGRSGHRFRSAMVASQVALALGLTVAAGLMVRSHRAMTAVDVGFQSEGLLSLVLTFPEAEYPDRDSRAAALDRLHSGIARIPGVDQVSANHFLPLTRPRTRTVAVALDPPTAGVEDRVSAIPQRVLPGYFEMMGIPLVHGRDFTLDDHREKLPTLIVSQGLARRFWPGESALGKEIRFAGAAGRVVGVVGDVLHTDDLAAPPTPVVYKPIVDAEKGLTVFGGYLVIRSSVEPDALAASIREVAGEIAPAIPVDALEPLDRLGERARARTTFGMALLLVAASIAVFLGMVGVYAVLAHAARRRTAEIGIRMALGASRERIRREMVRRGLRLAITGTVVGVGLSVLAGRAVESILFGVAPFDPLTYVTVTVLILGIAVVASLLPAVRAGRTSPAVTIRAE